VAGPAGAAGKVALWGGMEEWARKTTGGEADDR
jgi:hypothetical protein